MTDERDPKLSAHYRDLPREEPPRALDDAVLAASRRAVRRRPWLYPAVGIAAVMVLAVAITVQLERERPDAVAVLKEDVPLKPRVEAEKQAELAKPAQPPRAGEDRVARSAARPAPERRAEARSGGFAPDPKPAAPVAESELARRDAAAGVGAMADRKQEAAEMRAEEGPAAAARSAPAAPPAAAPDARARQAERPLAALQMDEAPLPWLERIARLREAGKHEEADRALAEFRKRYPDFRISDEMLKRVEKQ